jgi:hypothetical protein
LGGGPPCFPRDFTCPAVLRIFPEVFIFSPTGVLPSTLELSSSLRLRCLLLLGSPTTPNSRFEARCSMFDSCWNWLKPIPSISNLLLRTSNLESGLGSSRFARRYLGNRVFFPFLRVLRCFSSPACLLRAYVFNTGYPDMTPDGLPHSGIHGSRPAYGSPWHFAADRALLRLLAPRHPPYALCILTFSDTLEYVNPLCFKL